MALPDTAVGLQRYYLNAVADEYSLDRNTGLRVKSWA
jgi:hypothetical protein